jgi:hypothetical protein
VWGRRRLGQGLCEPPPLPGVCGLFMFEMGPGLPGFPLAQALFGFTVKRSAAGTGSRNRSLTSPNIWQAAVCQPLAYYTARLKDATAKFQGGASLVYSPLTRAPRRMGSAYKLICPSTHYCVLAVLSRQIAENTPKSIVTSALPTVAVL